MRGMKCSVLLPPKRCSIINCQKEEKDRKVNMEEGKEGGRDREEGGREGGREEGKEEVLFILTGVSLEVVGGGRMLKF